MDGNKENQKSERKTQTALVKIFVFETQSDGKKLIVEVEGSKKV